MVSLDDSDRGSTQQNNYHQQKSYSLFKGGAGATSLAQHIALLKQSLEAIESDKEGEDARISQEVQLR